VTAPPFNREPPTQRRLLSGLRYTTVDWRFDVADNDADDITGSLRLSDQFRDDMLVFVGVSKAFRAPNLNDLDGATDRASSGNIRFGNPDLDPEVGYTAEAGWHGPGTTHQPREPTPWPGGVAP
jgi:outer membrane receptor protein involved in Fe transport